MIGGLSLSSRHTLLLRHDGTVWATGGNTFGQLGIDPKIHIRTINFVQVVTSGVKAVATGGRHSMVLRQDDSMSYGSVWCTGRNIYGQLGDGSNIDKHSFVQVIPEGATAVAAGAFHSMVLKQNDNIWATGSNKDGQYGDGTTISEKTFVRVAVFDFGVRLETIMCT